jgi:histone deacetylase 1/2
MNFFFRFFEYSSIQPLVSTIEMGVPKIAYFSDSSFSRLSFKSLPGSMGSYSYSDHCGGSESGHPMDPKRLCMVDSLVRSLGILRLRNVSLYPIRECSDADLRMFHSAEYLDFLKSVTDERIRNGEVAIEQSAVHNIGPVSPDVDCTAFAGLWDYNKKIAGSSLDAAYLLITGAADIAINWAGGMDHAKRDNAAGFCYINDCVLAILELMKKFNRIMYIDIDFHHGDGVEEAFWLTDKVCTVSLHRFGAKKVFPGTGAVEDQGRHTAVNVPLLGGITDDQYVDIFTRVTEGVRNRFHPDVIVIQCGADSLAGDTLGMENGSFNLSSVGHSKCLETVRDWGLPLLVLGGGGYSMSSVAKCWALDTAALCGLDRERDLPKTVPVGDYFFDEYGVKTDLVVPSNADAVNFNSPGRIQQILEVVMSGVAKIGSNSYSS